VAAAHRDTGGSWRQVVTREDQRAATEVLYGRAEYLQRCIRAELAGDGLDDGERGQLRMALDDIGRARAARSPWQLAEAEEYLRDLGWLQGSEWASDVQDDGAAGTGGPVAARRVIDGTGLVLGRRDGLDVLLAGYRPPAAPVRSGGWPGWAAGLPRPGRPLGAAETVPPLAAAGGAVTRNPAFLAAASGLVREAETLAGIRRQLLIEIGEITGQPPSYEQLTGYQYQPPEPRMTRRRGLLGRRRPPALPAPAGRSGRGLVCAVGCGRAAAAAAVPTGLRP
jgi:hypothetical protein